MEVARSNRFRILVAYFLIQQVAWNKSSLLLKIIVQNIQTFQLFAKITKREVFTKVTKMPRWMDLVQRPSGPIKMREEAQGALSGQ
jgi:hypothetical protein